MDQKDIERLVVECLAERGFAGCNFPMVIEKGTLGGTLETVEFIPTWNIHFSCNNPSNKDDRQSINFDLEIPPNSDPASIRNNVTRILDIRLKDWE